MTMTDEEILSAAARLRAAKRRRVAKTCEVCGTPFKGIAQRRFCSDACRVRASRARRGRAARADVSEEAPWTPRGENESIVDYFDRVRHYLTGDRVLTESSVDLVRQGRMERTLQLMRATGASEEELEHERAEWEREYGWTRDDPPVEESEAMDHVETEGALSPREGHARGRAAVGAEPDPENECLRAEGVRRPGESSIEHVTRIRDRIMRGRVMTDDSVDVLRRLRDERSKHLDTL